MAPMSSPAFLLAAGFGTRLRPLTLHRPKPLVPLLGLPLLDQAVGLLLRHGLRSAVVNAHHLPEQIEAWAAAREDIDLRVSVEAPEILGTGGGLRAAMAHLADPFVVVNGDILSDVDLAALRAAVPVGGAAMALRTLRPGEPYGVVAGDGARVVDLVGLAVAEPEGPVDRGTHFTGVHAMSLAALSLVPAAGPACVVRTAYQALVPERRVAALPHRGLWFDLGTPAAYLRANLAAVAGELVLPMDPWPRCGWGHDGTREHGSPEAIARAPSARVEPPFWIGPGAELGPDVVLGPRCVVGAGARLRAGARARDAVIWDGVEIPAESWLMSAIAHDGGALEVPLAAPSGRE